MKTLLLTLLLSMFIVAPAMATQSDSSNDMLAMKKLTATETPDGESEEELDDSGKVIKKKEHQQATDVPDGESEEELDEKDKDKKD